MKLKFFVSIIFIAACCILSNTQLSAQQYYKVVKGNDNPATAEQVDDDVNTINDILSTYKINTAKMVASTENYSFWVDFVKNNKLPAKRKEIIFNFLKQMKPQLEQ